MPEDAGRASDKIGFSLSHELAEIDVHLTGDGVGTAAGSVVGESKDCV